MAADEEAIDVDNDVVDGTVVEGASPVDFTRDLIRWSESLAGIARTGLGFTQSLYERERYEEVLKVAADIKAAADDALEIRREQDHFVQEWLESVGEGVPGYVTPKVAVGAIVGNDRGQLLLVQRADSGIWLYPTGWADVGYSPAEVAVKEVARGDRHRVRAGAAPRRHRRPAHGLHPLRHVHGAVPLPCRSAASSQAHPLETSDVGWFGPDELPRTTGGAAWWGPMAFAAIDGERLAASFDPPRDDVWREGTPER